jgi:hypothetical protein
MINKEVFAQRMGLLAGRIGRELEGAVQAEYYRHLAAMLTTEQFVAATAIAFATWDSAYRNWPSPKQLVEMVTPIATPALSAAEAFERVLAITNDPRIPIGERMPKIQAMGATTVRAFRAAGGRRDFENVLEDQVVWVRKRFVDAYADACDNADAERAANLALASASEQVAALVNATAGKLSADKQIRQSANEQPGTPFYPDQSPKRIAAGGAR